MLFDEALEAEFAMSATLPISLRVVAEVTGQTRFPLLCCFASSQQHSRLRRVHLSEDPRSEKTAALLCQEEVWETAALFQRHSCYCDKQKKLHLMIPPEGNTRKLRQQLVS